MWGQRYWNSTIVLFSNFQSALSFRKPNVQHTYLNLILSKFQVLDNALEMREEMTFKHSVTSLPSSGQMYNHSYRNGWCLDRELKAKAV